MQRFSFLLLFAIIVSCSACDTEEEPQHPGPEGFFEIRGMDISSLPEVESYNNSFYDQLEQKKDFLTIISKYGVNTVRIRLWHTPENNHSSLAEVTELAHRCRQAGFKIMLDIHYSDTWADPGHQSIPKMWTLNTFEELKANVYAYTFEVAQIIQPEYIQIGNEINFGFLWNHGSNSNPEKFTALLQSAITATRAASPVSNIIIHYAGHEGSATFYNVLKQYQVDYDIIGLSYYPMWHGKFLSDLELALKSLKSNNNKQILLAEISYPFTLDYFDQTHNVIGLPSQILNDFPATPDGQKFYLYEIRKLLHRVGSIGFCYWGGELIAFRGAHSMQGSSYENQALFDFTHNALPAFDAFRQ